MNLKTILISSLILLCADALLAQDVEQNIRMLKSFKADGKSDEWNEPLNQYNTDTKLAFALANDDRNLYIIIESLDPATTKNILFGGITLNINIEGKKKNDINLTFPFHDIPENENSERQRPEKIQADFSSDRAKEPHGFNEHITAPQGLKIAGFKNIQNGILKPDNEFGITSGMSIKKNQDLIYEISIPLAQLNIDKDLKKAIAYNIKLNSSRHVGGSEHKGIPADGEKGNGNMRGPGGGMGGHGGGGNLGGGPRGGNGGQRPPREDSNGSESNKTDFWIKYKLVKA